MFTFFKVLIIQDGVNHLDLQHFSSREQSFLLIPNIRLNLIIFTTPGSCRNVLQVMETSETSLKHPITFTSGA